jgi:hypothetical protein
MTVVLATPFLAAVMVTDRSAETTAVETVKVAVWRRRPR